MNKIHSRSTFGNTCELNVNVLHTALLLQCLKKTYFFDNSPRRPVVPGRSDLPDLQK